jgi:hypothetical protein
MSNQNDRPPAQRAPRLLVALGVTVLLVAFVVLHVTGVFGPGSH